MESKAVFSLSVLFFWIKGSISVDLNLIKVSVANTILGFIPAGKDNQNIPLKNVSAAMISSRINIKAMIIGIIIAFISLSVFDSSFFVGVILLLLGVSTFLSGILTTLVIQRAGSDYIISVPFYEKSKLAVIQASIEKALINDTNKTDLSHYFDKK